MPSPLPAPLIAAIKAVLVAVVLGAVGAVSLATDQAVLVPSLAACVFLQTLTPRIAAAKPRAVVMGQGAGLVAAIVAVHLLGAATLPPFGAGHDLAPARAAAAVLAAALTLVLQALLRAPNAAGAALGATIALGAATADGAGAIRALAGIAVVAVLGEVARRIVLGIDPDA